MPSDCIHVAVAVMEEEFMLGPFGSALKQIHEVMAVYLPAVPQKHAAMQRHVWREAEPAFIEHWRRLTKLDFSSLKSESGSAGKHQSPLKIRVSRKKPDLDELKLVLQRAKQMAGMFGGK